MNMIRELLEGATALGACRKTAGINTLDKLVALYESPQGREFCAKHNYPSREQWTRIREHWTATELHARHIYIDETPLHTVHNPVSATAVGDASSLHITLNGAEMTQRIIAIRGANVNISAKNYAVFEIITDGTAQVTITKDETAIQL